VNTLTQVNIALTATSDTDTFIGKW